jgi:hypothetical protein
LQKTATKTGDYGIGLMIHSAHMTDDVPALNRFYEEVCSGLKRTSRSCRPFRSTTRRRSARTSRGGAI